MRPPLLLALLCSTLTIAADLPPPIASPFALDFHNNCQIAYGHNNLTCNPQSCYTEGGRCVLFLNGRCIQHVVIDDYRVRLPWSEYPALESCKGCKCVRRRLEGGRGRRGR